MNRNRVLLKTSKRLAAGTLFAAVVAFAPSAFASTAANTTIISQRPSATTTRAALPGRRRDRDVTVTLFTRQ